MYFIDNEIYNELLEDIRSNYTSVQKIKDKIEELKKEKEEYYSQYKIDELNDKIQVLQELLDGSDTNVGSTESEG